MSKVQCPKSNVQCPMSKVQCPMSNVRGPRGRSFLEMHKHKPKPIKERTALWQRSRDSKTC
ncbi:MAG: hypothetical protein DME19_17935 [Verrucomicrobia bacterium]|nr:MAG: hypothetical protein DME19_17935 [Verrucomicrobiota bacterium]